MGGTYDGQQASNWIMWFAVALMCVVISFTFVIALANRVHHDRRVKRDARQKDNDEENRPTRRLL
jgi:cytochrome c-type biogenesis protein CcmH/NrfF